MADNLNELSRGLLRRYAKKAGAEKKIHNAAAEDAVASGDRKALRKHNRKYGNRYVGVQTAKSKTGDNMYYARVKATEEAEGEATNMSKGIIEAVLAEDFAGLYEAFDELAKTKTSAILEAALAPEEIEEEESEDDESGEE